MADNGEGLLDILWTRLEADNQLTDEARLTVLAAFEGDAEFAEALGGTLPERPTPSGSTADGNPVGAYLSTVAVQGFRGIGPQQTLHLTPTQGLTVVAGRNGSGKSSFAEAVEVVLTGGNERWTDRTAAWRDGWRNLHHPTGTAVEVELVIEGRTPARAAVRRTWSDTGDLESGQTQLLASGRAPAPLTDLGWTAALQTFRPFLSYSELGDMLTGRPSAMYDALASILGLEQITSALSRLTDAGKRIRETAAQSSGTVKALAAQLKAAGDVRAGQAAALLANRPPDLDGLEALATGREAASEGDLALLRGMAALEVATAEQVTAALGELSSSAELLGEVRGTDAGRADEVAGLLELAVRHYRSHAPAACPVCDVGALDDAWLATTEQRIGELRDESRAVQERTRAYTTSLQNARRLVTAPPVLLGQAEPLGLASLEPVRNRWSALAELSEGNLAERLAPAFEDLREALAALKVEAAPVLAEREDRWAPLALQLAEWLPTARSVRDEAPLAAHLKQATDWLKNTAEVLRNDRLAPISQRSSEIWKQLSQDSNVTLGPVRLTGYATRRHVEVDVTVDDAGASALGVMSQGELHALGLSLFLPRATSPGSPFRFLVIDDPVQAMDPAKVDGLARVLHEVAKERQVIVFSHDDRLPEALRRLQLPATILQVTRRANSEVEIRKVADPVQRYLEDARALAYDEKVSTAVAARVVPGFCRMAMDAACVEVIRRKRLGAGAAHQDVEELVEANRKLYPRLALALFDDAARTGDVLSRVNGWSKRCGDAITAANKGAHEGGYTTQLRTLVDDTELLVRKLRS